MTCSKLLLAGLTCYGAVPLLALTARAQLAVVERVNLTPAGGEARAPGTTPAISADGRFVVFGSEDDTLVAGDHNGVGDIFHFDRQTGVTLRCSVDSSGVEGDLRSLLPSVSADGRFVSFSSSATNLVPGDTNGLIDIYLHDTWTRQTERISVSSTGGDPNAGCYNSFVNEDGSRVVFNSNATNLVDGDPSFDFDGYVRDRILGRTSLVTPSMTGGHFLDKGGFVDAISADGLRVLFNTRSSDTGSGETTLAGDIFLFDATSGNAHQISLDHQGLQVSAGVVGRALSPDGKWALFSSIAKLSPGVVTGGEHYYLRNLATGVLEPLVFAPSGIGAIAKDVQQTSFSANGRQLAFTAYSDSLHPTDSNGMLDIYVYDLKAKHLQPASTSSRGELSNGSCFYPTLSADGRFLAYSSSGTTLVPGDTNGVEDIFVVDRRLGDLELLTGPAIAGSLAKVHLRRGAPGDHVALLFDLGQPAVTGSPFGLLGIGSGYGSLGLQLGPGGTTTLTLPIAPGLAGKTAWLQAVEGSTGLLSNPWRMTLQ